MRTGFGLGGTLGGSETVTTTESYSGCVSGYAPYSVSARVSACSTKASCYVSLGFICSCSGAKEIGSASL